jgi:hypothetical protein
VKEKERKKIYAFELWMWRRILPVCGQRRERTIYF